MSSDEQLPSTSSGARSEEGNQDNETPPNIDEPEDCVEVGRIFGDQLASYGSGARALAMAWTTSITKITKEVLMLKTNEFFQPLQRNTDPTPREPLWMKHPNTMIQEYCKTNKTCCMITSSEDRNFLCVLPATTAYYSKGLQKIISDLNFPLRIDPNEPDRSICAEHWSMIEHLIKCDRLRRGLCPATGNKIEPWADDDFEDSDEDDVDSAGACARSNRRTERVEVEFFKLIADPEDKQLAENVADEVMLMLMKLKENSESEDNIQSTKALMNVLSRTTCCLVDVEGRCNRPATPCGIYGAVSKLQRYGVRLMIDPGAEFFFICRTHRKYILDALPVEVTMLDVENEPRFKLRMKLKYFNMPKPLLDDHTYAVGKSGKCIPTLDWTQRPGNSSAAQSESDSESTLSDSSSPSLSPPQPVRMSSLPLSTLQKYKQHFQLPVVANFKTKLGTAVQKHFATIPVRDREINIIKAFVDKVNLGRRTLESHTPLPIYMSEELSTGDGARARGGKKTRSFMKERASSESSGRGRGKETGVGRGTRGVALGPGRGRIRVRGGKTRGMSSSSSRTALGKSILRSLRFRLK